MQEVIKELKVKYYFWKAKRIVKKMIRLEN